MTRPTTGQLLVSEVFGPTLQGEGPSAGQTAVFVRLGGCNLSCQWCDTAYTWDQERYELSYELSIRRTVDVAQDVIDLGSRLVVITGGEPALQASEALVLTRLLQQTGYRVEIETNGSVHPRDLAYVADLVVVSPKLSNARLRPGASLRWDVLSSLSALANTVFKFVIVDPADVTEVEAVAERLSLDSSRVWVMPEATEPAVLLERMARLVGPATERGWSVSNRLQVLLWGNERGR